MKKKLNWWFNNKDDYFKLSNILPMHVLLQTTLDLLRLWEFIRDSSILINVWSPEAPIHVARRPYLVPILGINPGNAFQLESLSLSVFRFSRRLSSEAAFGAWRLSWPFYKKKFFLILHKKEDQKKISD